MIDRIFRGHCDSVICSQFGDREYALQVLFSDASLLPANCDRFAECCDLSRCRRAIVCEVKGEGMKEVLVNREDVSQGCREIFWCGCALCSLRVG